MSLNRRKFLNLGGKVTLLAFSAFSFGCSMKAEVKKFKKKNPKIAIVYGTRYGATHDTAKWIQLGLAKKVKLFNIDAMHSFSIIKDYDLVIIGSGIWEDGVHKKMLRFLQTQKELLKDKIVASFIVCGTTGEDEDGKKRIEKYFEELHSPLDEIPPLNEHFGGRIVMDELSVKDRRILKNVQKIKFESWDRTQPDKAKKFGTKTLEII